MPEIAIDDAGVVVPLLTVTSVDALAISISIVSPLDASTVTSCTTYTQSVLVVVTETDPLNEAVPSAALNPLLSVDPN